MTLRFPPRVVLSMAVLALGMFALAPAARAQELTLDWQAPPECPTEGEVRTRVLAMLGRSATAAQSLRAQGSIRTRGGEYVLSLRIDLQGQVLSRRLEAQDCKALTNTGAWLVAVAIDPNVAPPETAPDAPPVEDAPEPPVTRNPYDQPAPSTQPAPTTTARVSASDSATEPREPRSERKKLQVGYGASLLAGVWVPGLAGPMAALGLRGDLTLGPVQLGLRVAHHFSRRDDFKLGARAQFAGEELALGACSLWGARFRAGPCAGLSGQLVRGSTEGITEAQRSTRLWLSAELGAELRLALLEDLDLLLAGAASLPLTARPVFHVTGVGSVGEVNLVSASASLGISVQFR